MFFRKSFSASLQMDLFNFDKTQYTCILNGMTPIIDFEPKSVAKVEYSKILGVCTDARLKGRNSLMIC